MNIIPFDLAQITSNVNRTRAETGLPTSTLNGSGQMHVAIEPQTFDWQGGVAENDRAWLVDKPGRTRALTANRTLAVFGGNNTSGERAIATALSSHGSGRYDFESENFVCGGQTAAQGGPDDNSAQAGHIVYALQHAQIGRNDDAGPQGKGYQAGVAFTQDNRSESDAIAGNFGVRRLTPIECERLQGFQEIENSVIIEVCKEHQKRPAIAVDQCRKKQKFAGSAERTSKMVLASSAEPLFGLNNPKSSKLAQINVHIFCGETEVVIRNHERLLSYANNADTPNSFPPCIKRGDFVQSCVGVSSIAGQIIRSGKEEYHLSETCSVVQENGKPLVRLSGNEIMRHVGAAYDGSIILNSPTRCIILDRFDAQSLEQALITWCCYVVAAMSGCIPMETLNANSLRIEVQTRFGYTAWGIDEQGQRVEMSDSVRYRALGNAVNRKVAEWLDRQIVRHEYDP